MDLDQMAYRCPKAEVVEIVRLEGYRLTFAAAGSGLATIFPEEGSHVDGVLWFPGVSLEINGLENAVIL